MTLLAPTTWPSLEDVVEPIRTVIDGADQITCLAHKDADADSLGSALGFAIALRSMGRKVRVVVPEPLPRLIEHLPGFETVEVGGAPLGDTVFTFDCATLGRFGERRGEVERARTVVNIDHHLSNTAFGTINLVEATASATGQVIYRLLRALGAPISPSVATNLYAALFTDTGGFRHENTTETALRLAATLVAAGADPGWVALKSYKSRSLAQVRLEGMAVAGDALGDGRTPALVRGDVLDARADRSGPAGLRGHHRHAPEHRHHADRDSLQGDCRRPHQDQRAHARAN